MGKVNVAHLKEGMVLATNLVDTTGRCLLAQGAVIQQKHIRIMKSWGITEADVKDIDQEQAASEAMAEIDPFLARKCEDYVTPFFRNSNQDHEVMKEIRRLTVTRLAKRWSENPGLEEVSVDLDAVEVSERLPDENVIPLQKLVANGQLASFPDIYFRIDKALRDPKSSVSHLADIISTDTSLSAKLLRLANSAFYGLPSKTDSVTRAITLIGTKEISTLATGILAIRYFKDIPQKLINMEAFWTHSVACGLFASILAQRKIGFSEEKFFIGGLLHDIGRLIMAVGLPQSMAHTVILSRKRSVPLNVVEAEIFGFDHTQTAALLMQKWEFPATLENMVRFHHDPVLSPNPLEASIIHVADIMAIAFQFGHSGEVMIPPLNVKAWEALAVSQSVIEPTLDQAERLVNETIKDFLYE